MSPFNFTTKQLFILVLAFIGGITFACQAIYGLLCLAIAAGITYKESHRSLLLSLGCCFFFFGAMRYYQHRDLYFAHADVLEKNCNVIATVQEILPRFDEQEPVCILLRVTDIEYHKQHHSVAKKIYLFLPFYTKLWLKPHQTILLKNIILKHPRSASYQEYLIKEGIWAVAHQKSLSYTTIKKPSLVMQQIDAWCSLPLQATGRTLSQLTHSLYISIFCGKKIKSQTTTEIKKLFQYWGLSHHLARSGLHLIILIGMLLFLFSCIPCSAYKKQWAIIMIVYLYYLMTYSSVAFLRAFFMYMLYTLCKQLHLPHNPIHILLITTLLILTLNPHHLFFLDFQLSFSITLLIIWFSQVTQNIKTVAS